MITQLGLSYLGYEETVRHNKAMEAETERSNIAKEKENIRANIAREEETHRANTEQERLKLLDIQEKYRQFNLDYSLNQIKAFLSNADSVTKAITADSLIADWLNTFGVTNPWDYVLGGGTKEEENGSESDAPTGPTDEDRKAMNHFQQMTQKFADKALKFFKHVGGKSTEVANKIFETDMKCDIPTAEEAYKKMQSTLQTRKGAWNVAEKMADTLAESVLDGTVGQSDGVWRDLLTLVGNGVNAVVRPVYTLGCYWWVWNKTTEPNGSNTRIYQPGGGR